MKKILSLMLALLICFGTFSSVFALSPTDEQLAELKDYGVFEGDANGNLRLDENINRAEAIKMICTTLCLVPQPDTKCSFPDVAPGHWAEGWIELGKGLGIVKGDENGNFRPFAPVTNEEYIKMLIVALGYDPMADARGGFPAGYITVANTYGITEGMQFGVGEPAKRGDVAVMTHRGLDVPLMSQTGFGSQVEYSIMDGENGIDKKTLRLELDPDYVYPVEKTDTEEKSGRGSADFSKSAYTYEDVEIANLSVKDGEYSFNDKKKSKLRIYRANSSTYVYMSDETVPLSTIKDGMFARVLCAARDEDGVRVLGIELFETSSAK